MNDDPDGEPAPDPSVDGEHLVETPAVGIARREIRAAWGLLGVAAVALAVGVVVEVFILPVPHSGWHGIAVGLLTSGGLLIFQGVPKVRNGRATLRDELRRQHGEGTE
ncbi:hypothetical protein [Leifsonia sp. EB34]|uniref:hypothetical protein n=1 Tax=Leifsonia sp. EB34 TaxID=3156303 RepID=UPI003516A63C